MFAFLLAASLVMVRDSTTGVALPAAVAQTVEIPTTIWIDPEQPPRELQPAAIAAQLRPDSMFVHGHVTEHGRPVKFAAIHALNVQARTNADGYFSMHVPPGEADVVVTIDGVQRHVISNTSAVAGGDVHFIVQLEHGDRDDTHKMNLMCESMDEERPQGNGTPQIPNTIRVGFDCATANTCARVEIMSLNTYVKRGLNDEWIASWLDDSLRAGAVAYRSYGAWHVAHPRTANYDICSTTSCQVNDGDTSLRTDLAVDATEGFVLVSNGGIFRSEYSAENNNLLGERSCSNIDRSCGDGFAGSPAAGWPCLADFVCEGHSCFGHGRGMCQWGSQRWALLGASWLWILGHYYHRVGATVEDPYEKRPRRRAVRR